MDDGAQGLDTAARRLTRQRRKARQRVRMTGGTRRRDSCEAAPTGRNPPQRSPAKHERRQAAPHRRECTGTDDLPSRTAADRPAPAGTHHAPEPIVRPEPAEISERDTACQRPRVDDNGATDKNRRESG